MAAVVDLATTDEEAAIVIALNGEQGNQFGDNADLAAAMPAGEFVVLVKIGSDAVAFRKQLLAE